MHRVPRVAGKTLSALYDERDHLAIKISLLKDEETPDARALNALKRNLDVLEKSIGRYRPPDA
jgi:hypothetical protein